MARYCLFIVVNFINLRHFSALPKNAGTSFLANGTETGLETDAEDDASEIGQTGRETNEEGILDRGSVENGESEVEQNIEEANEEAAEKEEHFDIPTGVVMFTIVGFFMLIFYLVHWHDKDIRHFVWNIMAASISIFIAVLTYCAIKDAVMHFIVKPSGFATGPISKILPPCIIFFVLWLCVEGAMYFRMGSPIALKATGTIGAHIVGFAGLQCFGEMQLQLFSSNWCQSLIAVAVAAVVMIIFALLGHVMRDAVNRLDDGDVDPAEEAWDDQCIETENDFIGMTVSFVFVMSLRYFIAEEVPHEHEPFFHVHTTYATNMLLVTTIVFALVVFIDMFIKTKFNHYFEEHLLLDRLIALKHTFFSMCCAWCFFFWGLWYFSKIINGTSVLLGKLFLAVVLSLIGTVVVFIIDFFADRFTESSDIMRANITGVAITIGFAWEKAFDRALECITSVKFVGGSGIATETFMTILSIIVIYPGWRLYILPKTDKRLSKEVGQNPHPCSMICPENYKDVYESSTSEDSEDNHNHVERESSSGSFSARNLRIKEG